VPTKLEQLIIGEVSGVDAAANMLDGWIVQKSKLTADQRDALEKEVTRILKTIDELSTVLASTMGDLADAPQAVQDAAATLLSYLEEMSSEMDSGSSDYAMMEKEAADAAAAEAEVNKAVTWRTRVRKLLGFDELEETFTEDDFRSALEDVLKDGPVVFDGQTSYEGIREYVGEALHEMMPDTESPRRYSYVRDISPDGKALIFCYKGDTSAGETYVAAFTGGTGGAPVVLAPHAEWTLVTISWVAAPDDNKEYVLACR